MNALTGKSYRVPANLPKIDRDKMHCLSCVPTRDNVFDRSKLISRAHVILDERKRRSTILSKSMLGEPAWDLLLNLYTARDMALTVRQLVALVDVPKTTLLRWIAYLEEKRLITRCADENDRRLSWICLGGALELLDEYFADFPDFVMD